MIEIQQDLSDRVAIVTGAHSGIGQAIARRLLRAGCSVSLWGFDASEGEARLAGLPQRDRAEARSVDVREEGEIAAAVRAVEARFGRIDILINNAGVIANGDGIAGATGTAWRAIIDTNLTGTFLCCRAVLPGMKAAGYGRIVNIASVAGKEGNPAFADYTTSKAAVIGLTKALGRELARFGVLVNCVTPGTFDTDMFRASPLEALVLAKHLAAIPVGRVGDPAELAELVAWLSSEKVSYSAGAVFDASGGRASY